MVLKRSWKSSILGSLEEYMRLHRHRTKVEMSYLLEVVTKLHYGSRSKCPVLANDKFTALKGVYITLDD
jgi:hypothetical protein